MKESSTTRYYKPDLESAIDEKIRLIEAKIPISAVAYAEKRYPLLTEDDIRPYWTEFNPSYQDCIFLLNDGIRSSNLEADRITQNDQYRSDIADFQNQLTMAQERQLHEKQKSSTASPAFRPIKMYIAIAVTWMLCLFEGVINRPTFSAWGYNLAEAIAMSIALGVVLATIAHYFKRIIGLGKNVWQQRAIGGGIVLMLTVLFWFLADVRAHYLTVEMTDNGRQASFSPLPFVALSLLLFIASLAICHFMLPTHEQRAQMRQQQHQHNEGKELSDEIDRLKKAIDDKELANSEMNSLHNSLQEYGKGQEERIVAAAKLGLAKWKKHNLLHRADGKPKCFDDTEYPFEFKLFFLHVNLL